MISAINHFFIQPPRDIKGRNSAWICLRPGLSSAVGPGSMPGGFIAQGGEGVKDTIGVLESVRAIATGVGAGRHPMRDMVHHSPKETAHAQAPFRDRTGLMSRPENPRVASAQVHPLLIDRWSPRSFAPDPLSDDEIASLF